MLCSRFLASMAALVLFSNVANADDDMLAPLEACIAIESDPDRAACLEAETAALLAARDRGAFVVIGREDVQALREDTFGLRERSAADVAEQRFTATAESSSRADSVAVAEPDQSVSSSQAETERGILGRLSGAASAAAGSVAGIAGSTEPADEIRVPIVRVQERAYGKVRFHLDNGQVWDQIQGTPLRVRSDDAVAYLRRAALGSYLLRINGKGRSVRVRRVE